MVILTTLVCFFAALLVVYVAAAVILALSTRFRMYCAVRAGESREALEKIHESSDKIKNQLFIISVGVTFFGIAPFLSLLFLLNE